MSQERIRHLRAEASEYRRIASNITHAATREAMLEVAEQYDAQADQLDREDDVSQ